MKYILLREDGGVSVMSFIDGTDPSEELRKWSESSGQTAVLKENIDLPDVRFRGAWRHDGKAVSIDLVVAKGMAMDTVRQSRAAKFEALDVEVSRYILSDPERAKKAEQERQALRDLPLMLGPKIEAAKTPDDLVKIIEGLA